MMRLQKYLAHAGVCSRRKAEQHILGGLVRVNGQIKTELGTKVDPDHDAILYKGESITLEQQGKKIYIALNKPVGFVTSCSQDSVKIVMDLIDIDARIYPVGRLDKDSTGLLLLTNDGDLHNKMSHPSFNHEKEYEVKTRLPLKNAALKKMEQGMIIDGTKTRRAKVHRLNKNVFRIILKQGLNRQIRKMVSKTGNTVVSLKRIRMSNIKLGNLKKGAWRYLSAAEAIQLQQSAANP